MPTSSFAAHIEHLADHAYTTAAAAAVPGAVKRPWSIPAAYPDGVPPHDPSGFAAALSRSDINEYVLLAYTTGTEPDGGRIGQVAAGKLALDHVACRERAAHGRHATPQRLRAWAAARRAGHGDATRGVFGALAAAVGDAAAAATAVSNAQT